MSHYQSISRPDGPLTDDVVVALLAELGETMPARSRDRRGRFTRRHTSRRSRSNP